ncbi:hypothetical protein CMK12_08670 [Candidatus Poribacteria bacterium]|nr:hypothetical protein [Candidatus Poribacteria bacterium]
MAKHRVEKVTKGETIEAMIINGLGFTDRPLSYHYNFLKTSL